MKGERCLEFYVVDADDLLCVLALKKERVLFMECRFQLAIPS